MQRQCIDLKYGILFSIKLSEKLKAKLRIFLLDVTCHIVENRDQSNMGQSVSL